MITVTIDYKDRSQLVDGLPVFHYRLTYSHPSREPGSIGPRKELRTHDIDTAYDFVMEAIRTCRDAP